MSKTHCLAAWVLVCTALCPLMRADCYNLCTCAYVHMLPGYMYLCS